MHCRIFSASLLQGDFGQSYVFRQTALGLILERMTAMVDRVVVTIWLGVSAAAYLTGRLRRGFMARSLRGMLLPGFGVGRVLICLLEVYLGWFTSSGRGETAEVWGLRTSLVMWNGWHHIIRPAVTPHVRAWACSCA